MAESNELANAFQSLQREGMILAGGLTDVAQRSATYRHIYRESGNNHIFPLLAAHGALWSRNYFAFGMRWGQVLSWQYLCSPQKRSKQLGGLTEFANAFREINRIVCADIYTNFHFSARYGEDAAAFVSSELLGALLKIHSARRTGVELSLEEKRSIFEAHFLHEQRHIVEPRIRSAVEHFQWPVVRWIALRPRIGFAFLPKGESIRFRDFSCCDERIAKGMRAFDLAAQAGWQFVESSLRNYALLPESFFREHFDTLRDQLLVT